MLQQRRALQSMGRVSQLAFNLVLARYHEKRGRLSKARAHLDKTLSLDPAPDGFILAFDGKLLIGEGQTEKARSSFQECVRVIPLDAEANDKFAAHFADAWLRILDEKRGYEEIQSAVLAANHARGEADQFVKAFLPVFPLDDLRETFGHRRRQ